jgi:hypothetical protein
MRVPEYPVDEQDNMTICLIREDGGEFNRPTGLSSLLRENK